VTRIPLALRRVLAAALGTLAVAGALVAVPGAAAPAAAADLRGFDPGNIISDAIFYDSTAMSAAQVQSFLDTRGAGCAPAAGSTCLKDFRQTTWTRPADTRCTGTYTGAADETAARIVAKVAVACGINPQVLLVTLQKEQGLVTASAGRSAAVYQKAMGYGCPDTAACDAQYYGFFNQVYSAARQFQNYAKNPSGYAHRAGMTNQVRFHPTASCGSSPVYIANQATASLYNYTPYQPNAAALAAGYGTGDGCSSYGNRNFWNYFTDWFGTTQQRAPIGAVDSVTSPAGGSIRVTGWALDLDTTAPISVHVYVDGVATSSGTAALSRPDVAAAHGKGDLHGYSLTLGTVTGSHQVCVYAIDATGGPNSLLGCAGVLVTNAVSIGALDSASSPATGRLRVWGWALDPDTTAPIQVHVYVDGAHVATATADESRPDVGRAYGKGDAHGYTVEIGAADGTHSVCVYAIDSTGGTNPRLGCSVVTVRNGLPVGALDTATKSGSSVRLWGWALDPDTTAPIDVHVYVDGRHASTVTAAENRPDVDRAYGKGAAHGYTVDVALTEGTHQVCAWAIDSAGGRNPQIGCATVVVRNELPIGSLDTATSGMEEMTLWGWALDPDTTAPIDVHVYVDGKHVKTATAGENRADVGGAYPASGAAHGYTITLPSTPGKHEVCVWAIDSTGGQNPRLACRTLDVNGYAFGVLDSVTAGSGTIRAWGWAIDPNTTAPIAVHVYVDGAGVPTTANVSRPDVDAAHSKGPLHGFDVTMAAARGAHSVCAYAIDYPGGTNPLLGCKSVTVP
jgi:hypothetical protein